MANLPRNHPLVLQLLAEDATFERLIVNGYMSLDWNLVSVGQCNSVSYCYLRLPGCPSSPFATSNTGYVFDAIIDPDVVAVAARALQSQEFE